MKVGVAWITGGQGSHYQYIQSYCWHFPLWYNVFTFLFWWNVSLRTALSALVHVTVHEYKCFLFLVSLAKWRLATVICNHICPLVGGCPPPPLPRITMALLPACVASRLNNEDEQLDFWAHVVEIFSINLTIECNVYCLKRKYGKLIFNNNRISWISCCRRHLPSFFNFECKYLLSEKPDLVRSMVWVC